MLSMQAGNHSPFGYRWVQMIARLCGDINEGGKVVEPLSGFNNPVDLDLRQQLANFRLTRAGLGHVTTDRRPPAPPRLVARVR
jgi:hypothetical protein